MATWRRKTPGKIQGKRGKLRDYWFWVPHRVVRGGKFTEACFVLEDDSEILVPVEDLRKALQDAPMRDLWIGPFKIDEAAKTVYGVPVTMEVKWTGE